MTQETKYLFEVVEKNRAAHISFFQELVRTQAQGEGALNALIAKRFQELGGTVEEVTFSPKNLMLGDEFAAAETLRPKEGTNLVATFPGTGGGKSLILWAHSDLLRMPDALDWEHDPYAGDIVGNKIIGWGVADDLVGIAVLIASMHALRVAGLQPAGDVYLCSTISKSNSRGIAEILKQGYHADAALHLHPAESGDGLREIQTESPGVLKFRVTVTGEVPNTTEPDNETAFAHLGTSAVDTGVIIIQALKELDVVRGKRVYHKSADDRVGRSTNLLIGHITSGSEACVGEMPTEFTIGAQLFFPPSENLAPVREEVEEAVMKAGESDSWLKAHPPLVDWLVGTESTAMTEEEPIYQALSNAIEAVTGAAPSPNPLQSLNDIRNPWLCSGIPTVGFGPSSGYGAQDEWVDIDEYIGAIKIAAKAIIDWTAKE